VRIRTQTQPVHWQTRRHRVSSPGEVELAPEILVLAEGHCLAGQSLAACGRQEREWRSFEAASVATLINLVAEGYGSTLVPALAVDSVAGRNAVLRPLAGGASRTIGLAASPTFPRPQALKALERVIAQAVGPMLVGPKPPELL
jgi:LysR family transcriptional regulator, hydrogen peroxide-inducible genes activator